METIPGTSAKDEGLSLLKAGKTRESIAKLEEALRLDSDDPLVHMYLGAAYNAVPDKLHAIHHFEESLRLQESANGYYNLGLVYESVHRINEAVRLYGMAVDLDPHYSKAIWALQRLHNQHVAHQHLPIGG